MKIKKRWILLNPWLALMMPALILFGVFYVLPFFWLIRVSFYQNIPGGYMKAAWVLDNYKKFWGDYWYIKNMVFFSFKMAVGSAFFAMLFSYPLALGIIKSSGQKKQLLLIIVLAPLLVSMVCLVLGMIILLRNQGILNYSLQWIGITSHPIKLIYSNVGVFIGLTYVSVPYMVLCLLDNLSKIDPSLEEAAINLGATGLQSFLKVTFPLSMPGLFSGSLIVFSMNFCAFAIPLMMGTSSTPQIGLVIYRTAMTFSNVPFAAAMTFSALFVSGAILFIYSKIINKFFFNRLGV